MSRFNKQTVKKTTTMPGGAEVLVTLPGKDAQYRIKKENLATELGVSTAPLYKEVAISSAEILALFTTNIELLPTPVSNRAYYDIDKIILEYTQGGVPYTFGGKFQLESEEGLILGECDSYLIKAGNQNAIFKHFMETDATAGYPTVYPNSAQQALSLSATNANPTGGNGTMIVKIWYTVRDFGSEL